MKQTQIRAVNGELLRSIDEVDSLLASVNADLSLDFSNCTFVSVEALEWLEEMLMRAQSLQCRVSLVNLPPSIYKVFKVAHIDIILLACGSPSPSTQRTPAC